jgi:hypothetical protein
MTNNEIRKFEEFLSESFEEGFTSRELRLSEEEREYIKSIYPKATIREIAATEYSDGRMWFEVELGGGTGK